MSIKENFTTPVGRMVGGSLVKPNDKDAEGRPLVIKTGPNAGQPRVEYYLALAIPKGPEAAQGPTGWMSTEWGQKLRKVGESFLPHAAQMGDKFAWKVKDGDSAVPGQGRGNQPGKAPRDREGFPGHWILSMSNGFQPQTYTLVGQTSPAPIPPEALADLGHYVQVNLTCDANGSNQQPGVYLNTHMVCLIGYGQKITTGPDVSTAGFGGQPLPAGASTTPAPAFVAPVQAAVPPTPPTAYAPILTVPQVPVPAAPPVPTAARAMSAKAQGASYESLLAAGWTDALLTQHGMFA